MRRWWRSSFFLLLVFCIGNAHVVAVHADTPIPLRSPDEPRRGDPDLSKVSDPYLTELYLSTVVRLRELEQDALSREEGLEAQAVFKAEPRPLVEKEYLVDSARAALEGESSDWPRYRAALWAAKAGMTGEEALVPVIRAALTAPRLTEKMTTSHGLVLRESLEALGENNTNDAIELLLECTTKEFWGQDPMRSMALRTKTRESVIMLRTLAVMALAEAKAELALPALEELAALYPDAKPVSKPTTEYEFEDGAGYTIAERIWTVRKNAGLPTGTHPRE